MSVSERPTIAANPYAAPITSNDDKSTCDPTRVMLRKVAARQRWLIASIGLVLLLTAVLMAVGHDLPRVAVQSLASLAALAFIASAALTYLLASSLFKSWVAILLVIPGIIPYVGLVIVLLLNVQAIRVLRRNGIRVGLLGAAPSSI